MISFLEQLPVGVSLKHGTAFAFGCLWRIDYALIPCDGPLPERIIMTSVKYLQHKKEVATDCSCDSESAAVFELIINHMSGRTSDTIRCLVNGTDFQKRVWKALADIKVGHTETYGALAVRIGAPGAVRAVGTAVGRNPLGLLLPCHRVVPSAFRLWPGNYAWGRELKQTLLEAEGIQPK